jgi:nitrite reductase/ring-hydroxylating ferredoxin subunit
MTKFINVAAESELVAGRPLRVKANGVDIVLVTLAGSVHAFGAACTHDGGPLDEGELEMGCIRCPWHFSLFDVKTGAVVESPAADPIPVYEVRVENGAILVGLSAR